MRRRLTRNTKNKRKNQIIILSTICLLLILTVGYAAFDTNLNITAKGNIKAKDITDDIVTSGDGLYEDEYEEGRYIYRGQNPDNYIWFNEELWRIISKEVDGTYKIIRNELLSYRPFDSVGNRNTGYCSQGLAPLNGCDVWSSTSNMVGSPAEFVNGSYHGYVDKDSEINTYLNGEYYNNLASSSKEQIINKNWNIGEVTYRNSNLEQQILEEECFQWNGKIGLITASEYIRANSNLSLCGTYEDEENNLQICLTTNWLSLAPDTWWTISPAVGNECDILHVFGYGEPINSRASNSHGVRPVLFLKSSTKLLGMGTIDNPFRIIN